MSKDNAYKTNNAENQKISCYKSILIIGKDHIIPKEIKELYEKNKDDYLLIGDGKKSISGLSLDQLKGRIDKNTRINICSHGNVREGEHFIGSSRTGSFLEKLAEYSQHPLNVHLYSCFAGAAADAVEYLPAGSVLTAHGENKSTVLDIDMSCILEVNRNLSTTGPILDFVNSPFLNSAHTGTIVIKKNSDEIFKFTYRSKHIEEHPELFLPNPENIVKYYDEMRMDFIMQYYEQYEQGKGKIDKDQIKEELSIKELSIKDAEEWAKNYFLYLAMSNDQKLLEALKSESLVKNPEQKKFENIIDHKTITGWTALRLTMAEHTDMAEALIKAGANVNDRDKNGNTSLMLASKNGNLPLIKTLIEYGANVNEVSNAGNTALKIIVNENGIPLECKISIVKSLIEAGANIDLQIINAASKNINNRKLVKVLVEAILEANIDLAATKDNNTRTILMYAAEYCDMEKVETLITKGSGVNDRDKDGLSVLMHAAKNSDAEIVRLLVNKYGANVNDRDNNGSTPIIYAASSYDSPSTAKALIELKANVNIQSNNGFTPLICASRHYNSSIVALLIKAGADIEAKDYEGRTPLMHIMNSPVLPNSAFDLLVEAGANVNAQDNNGSTVLMLMCEDEFFVNPTKIQAFLKVGADTNIRNKAGKTVFDIAKENGHAGSLFKEYKSNPILWLIDNDAKTNVIEKAIESNYVNDQQFKEILSRATEKSMHNIADKLKKQYRPGQENAVLREIDQLGKNIKDLKSSQLKFNRDTPRVKNKKSSKGGNRLL